MNTLTQVIHRCQMLFPQRVQGLQHDAFLEVTHHLGANHFFLLLVNGNRSFQNTFAQRLFVQLWLFVQPLFDRQFEIEVVFQTFLQAFNIPHFFQRLRWNVRIDSHFEDIFANAVDGFAHVGHIQQFVTLGVDSTTLIVGNIIIFKQLLTNIEVAALHFTLCVGNRFGHPRVLNRFARFHPQFTHHARHTVRGENTHQGIFH
ncbi:hypothetical protein D3C72_1458080 [compost metagenome]